jgi:hypothetical protein
MSVVEQARGRAGCLDDDIGDVRPSFVSTARPQGLAS